jgi:hypothetical protein
MQAAEEMSALLRNLQATSNRLSLAHSRSAFLNTKQASIFTPRFSTQFHHSDSNFEVEVIHITAQNLCPETASLAESAAAILAFDVTGSKRINTDSVAHACELCSEGGIRLDSRTVFEGEGM